MLTITITDPDRNLDFSIDGVIPDEIDPETYHSAIVQLVAMALAHHLSPDNLNYDPSDQTIN